MSHVDLSNPAEWARQLPRAGNEVDGRTVRSHIPNMDSIDGTVAHSEVLPGVRIVSLSVFDYEPGAPTPRILDLANQIQNSNELNPLIVAVDKEGLYIVEGGHRLDALLHLKAAAIPALVVLDLEDLGLLNENEQAREEKANAKAKSRPPVEAADADVIRPPMDLETAMADIVGLRDMARYSRISTSKDPVFGEIGCEFEMLMVANVDETKAKEFEAVTQSFLQALRLNPGQAPDMSLEASKLMIGAIDLDRTDVLKELARACPAGIDHPFKSQQKNPQGDEYWVTPYGHALSLSRVNCMQVLAAEMEEFGITPRLGHMVTQDNRLVDFGATAFQNMVNHDFAPSALVAALRHQKKLGALSSNDWAELGETALEALDRNGTLDMNRFIRAFIEVGIYRANPEKTYDEALRNARMDVMEAIVSEVKFKKTELDTFDRTRSSLCVAVDAARATTDGDLRRSYEDCVLLAMDDLTNAGFSALAHRQFVHEDGQTVEPHAGVMEAGFNRVLVKFLDAGIDPKTPLRPGSFSLWEMAKSQGNEDAQNVIFSHGAKKAAEEAVASLQEASYGGPRP